MKIVVDASGIVKDLYDQKTYEAKLNCESLKSLISFIERSAKSADQHSIYVALIDHTRQDVAFFRQSLKGKIPSHRIQTCMTPDGASPTFEHQLYSDFLESFNADIILDHFSIKTYADESTLGIQSSNREKLKLAFVSPMPPSQTGIAVYSSELVDELKNHYDIDLIVDDKDTQACLHQNTLPVKAASSFAENAADYDAVLYHIGNSYFHQYQLPLIRRVPGIVVLHDFFLGDFQYYRDQQQSQAPLFARAMYNSDGYKGAMTALNQHPSVAIKDFPANYEVLRYATRVIVHSQYSKNLILNHYKQIDSKSISVIPHLRDSTIRMSKQEARQKLGIADTEFLACSFGVLDDNKLHKELIEAWNQSSLSSNNSAKLVLVGQDDNEYGQSVQRIILSSSKKRQISITGWTEDQIFKTYLAACDLAIQLRKNSRGETSGTVLDCMNHSIPTIINANGSMAEIDEDSAFKLSDSFSQSDLVSALNKLASDNDLRSRISSKARKTVLSNHSPEHCTNLYKSVIDRSKDAHKFSPVSIAKQSDTKPDDQSIQSLVRSVANTFGGHKLNKTLFIDVTATSKTDIRTGIERTTISLTREMILSDLLNVRVEPVYLDCVNGQWTYRYARNFTSEILGLSNTFMDDAPFEPSAGDHIIGLDHSGVNVVNAYEDGLFDRLKAQGVSLSFLVHDILPITKPGVFPPDSNTHFETWLKCLVDVCDHIIGVTSHVADEVQDFMARNGYQPSDMPEFSFSHHGADFAEDMEEAASQKSSDAGDHFLMVGTIEPRKRYDLALDIFEELWAKGDNSVLLIVGREGWRGLSDENRRNIPDLIRRIETHPELGNRLFWFKDADDKRLNELYRSSDALLAVSEDEGFGLPLIEAAQKGLPIIARDIPVFREVAGDSAFFIEGHYPIVKKDAYIAKKMAASITEWSLRFRDGSHPKPETMTWKSWNESAHFLAKTIFEEES